MSRATRSDMICASRRDRDTLRHFLRMATDTARAVAGPERVTRYRPHIEAITSSLYHLSYLAFGSTPGEEYADLRVSLPPKPHPLTSQGGAFVPLDPPGLFRTLLFIVSSVVLPHALATEGFAKPLRQAVIRCIVICLRLRAAWTHQPAGEPMANMRPAVPSRDAGYDASIDEASLPLLSATSSMDLGHLMLAPSGAAETTRAMALTSHARILAPQLGQILGQFHTALFFLGPAESDLSSWHYLSLSRRIFSLGYLYTRGAPDVFFPIHSRASGARHSFRTVGVLKLVEAIVSALDFVLSASTRDAARALMASAPEQAVRDVAGGAVPPAEGSISASALGGGGVGPRLDVDFGSPCSLCLSQQMSWPAASTCGHVFCWECIYSWLVENSTCPLCRQEGTVNQLMCVLAIEREDIPIT
ncbi:hypothetical protein H696_01525 [Fonticula alba]|uniref:RING-type E3 ubiquitin transferase n=1 Tax=Fonticula alba TaxID=691883 RepID=A0A058ZCL1_FONAL|nr:hypothetical protein H696_01525 [Fonticula alba]KCV72119.1 hypothetical protein H696_01525 [Fonticula alba]|eukprot:XP_009493697.1 hypothetical protein H696_01525 [Fonticula alba]